MKYTRIVNILKSSRPVSPDPGKIEDEVIRKIEQRNQMTTGGFKIFECLFGWAYISWARRVLVTLSAIIVLLFAYQQAEILKRITKLDSRTRFIQSRITVGTRNYPEGELLIYKAIKGRKSAGKLHISEKQLEQLINSFSEMDSKYKYLLMLIDENPELKKFVEEKLNEQNHIKFNL